MENDNDFLNQKIIPAEENLGDHNNEHKQIVLYCPEGKWLVQTGGAVLGVLVTQKRAVPENEELSHILLHSRTVNLLTLFRKGLSHWRMRGWADSQTLHPCSILLAVQVSQCF